MPGRSGLASVHQHDPDSCDVLCNDGMWGVLVKTSQTRLLANCLRLTVGTAGDNTLMLAALKASL
jgi:histidinol-phosphate/aromatic aminotransferase/cobyric acid decarboxylase-like protein